MNLPALISQLKQSEKATVSLKACTDANHRKKSIDALTSYIAQIRTQLEAEQEAELQRDLHS